MNKYEIKYTQGTTKVQITVIAVSIPQAIKAVPSGSTIHSLVRIGK